MDNIKVNGGHDLKISFSLVGVYFICMSTYLIAAIINNIMNADLVLLILIECLVLGVPICINLIFRSKLNISHILKYYIVVVGNLATYSIIRIFPVSTSLMLLFILSFVVYLYADLKLTVLNLLLNTLILLVSYFEFSDIHSLGFGLSMSFIYLVLINLYKPLSATIFGKSDVTTPDVGDGSDVGSQAYLNNLMMDTIKDINTRLGETKLPFKDSLDQLEVNFKALVENTETSSAVIEEEGASLENMSQSIAGVSKDVNTVAENIHNVYAKFQGITAANETNSENVLKTYENMNIINDKIREIVLKNKESQVKRTELATALTTITEINEQIKLLSLNASIEAAKSGEFGRGFSVIAVEMRKLSDMSKEFTTNIRTILASQEELDTNATECITSEQLLIESSKDSYRFLAESLESESMAISEMEGSLEKVESSIENFKQIFDDIKEEIGNIAHASELNIQTVSDNSTRAASTLDLLKIVVANSDQVTDVADEFDFVISSLED